MSSLSKFAALALIVSLALALPMAAFAQPKVPADFSFEKGKDSPGPVTFSHKEHTEKGEKCNACHTKIFKMKKGGTGPLTMAKMQAGEQCGTCHNGKAGAAGKTVFSVSDKANCEKCHKK